MARLSVRFHEVVIEAGHIEVATRGPFAGGGVPDAGADEHERAPAVGEAARNAGATSDLAVEPFDHVVRADPPAVPVRELVQQVGRRLADALAQAVRGGLEPPGFHLRGDLFGLGQGGFPGFHGEYGLEGGGRPFAVCRRRLREHVAHEMHHAPLVSRLGQHRADRGDESGAPVADHQAHALQAAFDHGADELLPAVPVLLHALRDPDDLPMAVFRQVGVSCLVMYFFRV